MLLSVSVHCFRITASTTEADVDDWTWIDEVHVLYTEVKVELPGRHILWWCPVLIREGKTDLNNLEQIDVTAHCLVMIIRRGLERAYGACHYTRKFGILSTMVVYPPEYTNNNDTYTKGKKVQHCGMRRTRSTGATHHCDIRIPVN